MASAPTPTPAASSGIGNNVAGLLCYLFWWLGGLIFLLIEPYKNEKTVRFHAFQSIFLSVALIGVYIGMFILAIVLTVIHLSIILIPIWLVLALGIFAAWIFLMFKAYSNETFKLPIIGELAAKQAGL
jgi:uncharacterized membrane protein